MADKASHEASHNPAEIEGALFSLHLDQRISDDDFYKGLVFVAHEWIRCQDMGKAKLVLQRCPEAYFRDVMPIQMASDDAFLIVAHRVAQAFFDDDVSLRGVQLHHRGPLAQA